MITHNVYNRRGHCRYKRTIWKKTNFLFHSWTTWYIICRSSLSMFMFFFKDFIWFGCVHWPFRVDGEEFSCAAELGWMIESRVGTVENRDRTSARTTPPSKKRNKRERQHRNEKKREKWWVLCPGTAATAATPPYFVPSFFFLQVSVSISVCSWNKRVEPSFQWLSGKIHSGLL